VSAFSVKNHFDNNCTKNKEQKTKCIEGEISEVTFEKNLHEFALNLVCVFSYGQESLQNITQKSTMFFSFCLMQSPHNQQMLTGQGFTLPGV